MINSYLTNARIIELLLTNFVLIVPFDALTFQTEGEVEKLRFPLYSMVTITDGGRS
jgi:hypothetical protein